jgi:hypothetical protein
VINDIEDVHAARLFVDYPLVLGGACPLAVAGVAPGNLLDGLIRGGAGHYELYSGVWPGTTDIDFDAAVPIPAGFNRLYIDVVLFDGAAPLQGNGSLAQITWGVGPCLPPPIQAQFLFWQGAQFADRDGNEIFPCSDLGVGCNGGLPVFPTNSVIAIEGDDQLIRVQVSSEGGKPSGVVPAYTVDYDIGAGPVACPRDLNLIDDHWECAAPALARLIAARPGYCGADTGGIPTIPPGTNQPGTTLLAGEVILNGVIDIADIANIAGHLGLPSNIFARQRIDYNDNGVVDIGDLALAAKNFGTPCPQPW